MEIQDDGRSLIFWTGEGSERTTGLVASIAKGIESYGVTEDEFLRDALRFQIGKATTDFLSGLGFFGLTRVLKHPACYTLIGKASPVNFSFDRYVLWDWDGGQSKDVKPSLYVEPQTDGSLLADFEIDGVPRAHFPDLLQIYQKLNGDFEYERPGERRSR
ncbi:MAG TPA: hypothetical protein ENH99_01110 [Candidatus Pacearchaeota archaeon]|nr:hypothetical protein [Candidatus Pacearchaeota archaeon]